MHENTEHRGFSVDYGVRKDDPLKDKIHTFEARGRIVGQYQVGPDGLISWYVVLYPTKITLLSPADPARFLTRRWVKTRTGR